MVRVFGLSECIDYPVFYFLCQIAGELNFVVGTVLRMKFGQYLLGLGRYF